MEENRLVEIILIIKHFIHYNTSFIPLLDREVGTNVTVSIPKHSQLNAVNCFIRIQSHNSLITTFIVIKIS